MIRPMLVVKAAGRVCFVKAMVQEETMAEDL